MAASSSFFQAYSIIEVENSELRELLYFASGNQQWILEAPLVLMVCSDLYRSKHFFSDIEAKTLEYTEALIVAVTDAALASQNLSIAAESLGLGVAFVGGIRNNTDLIIDQFALPELVFPLYLLCIGYPDENNAIKPRLSSEIVFHKNKYNKEKYDDLIPGYNSIMNEYYKARSGEKKSNNNWSVNSGRALMAKPRADVGKSIKEQGFITGIDIFDSNAKNKSSSKNDNNDN